VIITAYDESNPPVLHTYDPSGVSSSAKAAITTNWDEDVHHVIFDHLYIDGLIWVRGHHNTIQFSEGITGWDSCGEGNWSVFRLDDCDDCVVHHNYAHDIEGAGSSCGGIDRGAGLKEFASHRAIWEFNTIEGAPYWGYDLHRDSLDSTVRFNRFIDTGDVGIRFGGGSSPNVYGNVVHNVNWCMQHMEYDMGVSHDEYFNNVCSYTSRNIISMSDLNLEFNNNIISNVVGPRTQNLGVEPKQAGITANMNHNAYDSNAAYHYGSDIWGDDGAVETSLTAWRARFPGQELNSQEAAGGACDFVDEPTSASDTTFNFTPTDNFCTTGSSERGMLGPYGLVSCIGHACGDVDGTDSGTGTNPIQLTANSYVSLNPLMHSASVVSLADNNIITAGDVTLELDLYERGTLYESDINLITSGMVITGTGPFDLGSNVPATDTPVHTSMSGTTFVMPHTRYNHIYHMISLQGDASVQINIEGTVSNHALPQGKVFEFESGDVNGNVGAVITSDMPILVSHSARTSSGPTDASPVPPANTELWGICSGAAYVSASEDNTQVTIYTNTDDTGNTVTLNAGEKHSVCPSSISWSDATQGRGPAVHIIADKPVGAVQIADGDGEDQTAFYPTTLLNTRFGIPKGSQYIAINCPSTDTDITLYQPNGNSETLRCSANDAHPGKAYFGNPHANGVHIAEGSYLESTRQIYVIYEVAGSEDEHNLIGSSSYVEPIFSANMEGASPADDWMDARILQAGGGASITFPTVDNSQVAQFNYRAGSANEVWLRHNFGAYPNIDEEPLEELWLNLEYRISDPSIYNPDPGRGSKVLYINWSSPDDNTRTAQVVLSAVGSDDGNGHRFRLSREVFNADGAWVPGGEWLGDISPERIVENEVHYLQLHIRNSSNGEANGLVELYESGQLLIERRDVLFNDNLDHTPNQLVLTPQISSTPPGSAADGYSQYDNVLLYDKDPGRFLAPTAP
jgi:hypothetical protein